LAKDGLLIRLVGWHQLVDVRAILYHDPPKVFRLLPTLPGTRRSGCSTWTDRQRTALSKGMKDRLLRYRREVFRPLPTLLEALRIWRPALTRCLRLGSHKEFPSLKDPWKVIRPLPTLLGGRRVVNLLRTPHPKDPREVFRPLPTLLGGHSAVSLSHLEPVKRGGPMV